MRIIGNNPAADNAEITAVASGTLPSGQAVIVNADGTVSVIAATPAGGGTPVDYAAEANLNAAAFDSNSGKVVIMFSYYAVPKYIVGTVSGLTITFGTAASFKTGNAAFGPQCAVFDSNSNKVVFVYKDANNGNKGTAIVGTVSGTTMSFGSETVFDTGVSQLTTGGVKFDSNLNKVLIVYQTDSNDYGSAIVGTVSGNSISFGSKNYFNYSNTTQMSFTFDSNANKFVIAWRDHLTTSYGEACTATISGTSVSFGTTVTFSSGNTSDTSCGFDSNSNKVVIAYRNYSNSSYGTAIVGTISGTNISFGTAVVFNSGTTQSTTTSFDTANSKIVISYRDGGNSSYATSIIGTLSGTGISFGTAVVLESASGNGLTSTYDSTNNKVVIAYFSGTVGTSVVFQSAAGSTLTSENYIGMSSGAVDASVISQALGSAVVFESAAVGGNVASTFDSNLNKVVIVYQDTGNSFYGTAIVGTLSGTSISFGTPVVFSSANRTQEIQITFDSNSNKVVIAYDDKADGQKGKAVVGTVSGTGISFGSIVTFNNGSTNMGTPNAITFDSSSNKVVIAFQDKADSNKGKAIVGTVSGTNISFGSEATFLNADYATHVSATFDSNSNKVVIVYKDGSNSTHGYAVVGTVSSTSISFGTPVVFESAATNNPNVAFDTVNNKIVIAYADGTVGTAIVGTVSGTAISFGSPVIFNSTETTSPRVRFDATASKIVIAYGEGSSNAGTFKTGTVSGTSISFGSATVFESGSTNGQNGLVYDSNAGKMVLSYYSGSNSGYGTSKVLQTGYTNITRAEVASGSNAVIDIGCAISTNQLSLTAGQQYFVQTDGTLGLTAGSPSVIAGTAVSATDIIVKG